mgnify:CR=1 FL=1
MKKLLFIISLLTTVSLSAQVQKRFSVVGEFGTFTAVNDSIWRGSFNSWSDPLNEGYLPSGIQIGYQLIDATGKLFRVKDLNSATFSSANLDIVELQNSTAPIGQGSLYNPLNLGVIPPAVANALGVTPVIRSKIDIHNAVILSGASGGGSGSAVTIYKDTLTAGGTTLVVRYFGAGTMDFTEPSPGNYSLVIPKDVIPTGFSWFGINTDTDGGGDMTLTLDSNNEDDLFAVINIINRGNNQIVDLQTLGITIEQIRSSPATVDITLTSMSGFGSSGFNILARFE